MNPNDLIPILVQLKSDRVFVILVKDDQGKASLLYDPGMKRPWSSENEKLARFHADLCGGEHHTWKSAFTLLQKLNPDFEKHLHDRIAFPDATRN
jgi:hypothetical protein